MTTYAAILLALAAVFAVYGYFVPRHRKAALIVAGGALVLSAILFGADCAISCVRTGELYVPKR